MFWWNLHAIPRVLRTTSWFLSGFQSSSFAPINISMPSAYWRIGTGILETPHFEATICWKVLDKHAEILELKFQLPHGFLGQFGRLTVTISAVKWLEYVPLFECYNLVYSFFLNRIRLKEILVSEVGHSWNIYLNFFRSKIV